MAYSGESYCQNTGCTCEKCGKGDKNNRLSIINAGGSSAYLCGPCVRDILHLIEVRSNYHLPTWSMSRADHMAWMDPAKRRNTLGPDNLRVALGNYEDEFREMGKDYLDFKNGYTDRGKFLTDVRKHFKAMLNVVYEYLKKTE